ncbi:class I SAM-dependent methyltransferase [Planctomycetota bacterium]|nr:class I SAM-dependent methyltransferase [Planctomycetota bacterium]
MTTIEHTLTPREAKRFYDRYGTKLDWSDPFEGRAKAVAHSWVGLQPGDRVLELGIGCGHFQAHAAQRVGATGASVGVELSTTMLELTRAKAPAAHLVHGNMLSLPLASGSFDWGFSSYVLDLLPLHAIAPALREARRVLKAGAPLVLCSLTEGQTRAERLIIAMWKGIHALGPAHVGGCRPVCLQPLLREAGFEIERSEHVGQLGVPSEVILARA